MNCAIATVHAIAAKAIGTVCAIESHVSIALAKTMCGVLTWLLSLIVPV